MTCLIPYLLGLAGGAMIVLGWGFVLGIKRDRNERAEDARRAARNTPVGGARR